MVAEVNEQRRAVRQSDGDGAGLEPPWWGQALRRVLVHTFSAIGRCRFDVRVRGLENFTNQPGTLIVSNHRSDYDLILLAPLLDLAHRGRGPIGRMAFVAAEQMFHAGYVSSYLLAEGPERVRRLLYRAEIGTILRSLRAYPVPGSRERRLVIHLREVLSMEGDLPLEEVLRNPRQLLPGAKPGTCISEALGWRYNRELYDYYGLSIFTPALASKLRRRQAEGAKASLRRFAAVLDGGDSLFIAPEGGLSEDGGFGKIKAGLTRLVRETRREPRLLPVHIDYDTMTTGRAAAFISIGREMVGVRDWPRQRLEATVRDTMCSLRTATLEELISLEQGNGSADGLYGDSVMALQDRIFHKAWRLRREGRYVDPRLLDPGAFEVCWARFIDYCRRRRGLGPAIDPSTYENMGVFERELERTPRVPLFSAEDSRAPR